MIFLLPYVTTHKQVIDPSRFKKQKLDIRNIVNWGNHFWKPTITTGSIGEASPYFIEAFTCFVFLGRVGSLLFVCFRETHLSFQLFPVKPTNEVIFEILDKITPVYEACYYFSESLIPYSEASVDTIRDCIGHSTTTNKPSIEIHWNNTFRFNTDQILLPTHCIELPPKICRTRCFPNL